MEVVHVEVDGVGLGSGGGHVLTVADVGPVVRAHPCEPGDRGQDGVVAAVHVGAEGKVVAGCCVGRVGRVEHVEPVLGAGALARDEHDGR